jgi:Ca-activated chloride channel family protein
MKRWIPIALALVTVLAAAFVTDLRSAKTGSIEGVVANAETGVGIAGATVRIEGSALGATTDNRGHYRIFNVPDGSYRVCARFVGFAETCVSQLTITADHATVQNFQLTSTSGAAASQVITARRDLLKRTEAMEVRDGQSVRLDAPSRVTGHAESFRKSVPASFAPRYVPPYPIPPAHGGNTPPNGAAVDAMFFKHYGVNPFVATEDDHLSTFAIDCDNGSYTMTRAYLNDGNLPPDEAVRVEEFVNNLKYDYKYPRHQAFAVDLQGAPSRFGKNYQLLKIGIVGKKVDPENRQDANLVFVVDCSGSMDREDRLGLVRRSLRMLVDNLTTRDNVGIVIYGSQAFVALEPTSIRYRDRIIAAIEQLYPSGSTNAEAGIRLGYQMADRCFERGAINRIILCSDGVANVGQTGADDIFSEIKRYADRGITLSAIGFGMGNYNDVLMEQLGDKGNGYYAYVDGWDEARRVFMENLTGTLQVIARDVKIQVDFNPDVVERYRLIGYENCDVADDQFRDDKVAGGAIGSGHTVTALYELKLKDDATGDLGTVFVRYKDPDNFAVSEVVERINRYVFRSSFASATSDFQLAAAAAEFAEILRGSYWAKGSHLRDVLRVVQTVEREKNSDQVMELMDLIAKADRLKGDKEEGAGPFGSE